MLAAWPVIFDQPWYLVLALAAAVPLLVWRYGRRRGRQVGRLCVGLQVAAVALAALALAQPAVRVGHRSRLAWMVLQDASASAGGQAFRRNLPWPEDLPRQSYFFAADLARDAKAVDPSRTHLAPALRLAASSPGELAGVLIQTDGQFQDADWPQAAAELGRLRLPVVVVPMDSPPPDAAVRSFRAGRAADGAVDLEVSLLSNAHMNRTVRVLRVQPSSKTLLVQSLQLLAGQPATIRLTDRPSPNQAAWYRVDMRVAEGPLSVSSALRGDSLPLNDSAEAGVLPVQRRAAVIGYSGPMPALAQAFGMPMVAPAPGEAPREAAGWMDYAVVVLVDSGGNLLASDQRAALAGYVCQGGGLVLLGSGPHGSLDDRDDPLNQVAALVANPFERQPMRVIVALDASGSMAERVAEGAQTPRVKFDLAGEAVLSLRRHLTRADRLEVIAFADQARTVYDSQDAPPDLPTLRQKLAQVQPAGSTDIMNALAQATGRPASADRPGLVILVSDLQPTRYEQAKSGDLFDAAKAAAMFAGKHLRLAMVATVQPGAPAPPETAPLEDLARRLACPLVRQDRLTGLAEVFAQFVTRSRGAAVRTGQFPLELVGSPFGLAPAQPPPLDAYILSAPQGDVAAPAEVLGRSAGDPVLARRQVGLGRSVALAVPLEGGQNAALRQSPWLTELTTAGARWAMRTGDDPRFAGTVTRQGRRLHLELTARDERGWMNGLQLLVRLEDATGGPAADSSPRPWRQAPLLQTGPGRYEAGVEADGAAAMAVQLASGQTLWQDAPTSTAGEEYLTIGPAWGNLRRLAELTGGRLVSSQPTEIRELTQRWGRQPYTRVWPILLAAALAAMLIEWCVTRVVRSR